MVPGHGAARAQWRRLWLLYGMLVAVTASIVAFYVFARYRYVLVPLVVLCAAAGIHDVVETMRRRAAGARPSLGVDCGGMTGYTPAVKTAISIPDDLFHQVDLCSRRLKVSRSRLFADAVREYLARQRAPADATAAWNEVIAALGQPGDDPAAVALRRRSKAALGSAVARRR